METTFDKYILNDPKERELFYKEYNEFLLSEFVLEKMETEKLTAKALAQMAGVSPNIIKKIQNKNAEKVYFGAFTNVLHSLGYRISIEKM
jgi:hypothetical protein